MAISNRNSYRKLQFPAELNKWNKNVLTAKKKSKAKAKALAADPAEPPPPPLPAPAAAPPPAVPAGPAGPPIAVSDFTWGCSRCRYCPRGCSKCCPEKIAAEAAKSQGEADAFGELAALALPKQKRRSTG